MLRFVYSRVQFSSLGSLDEKWMSEFACSLSAGKSDDGSQLGIGKPLIVWPTVEDVRCSIEVRTAERLIIFLHCIFKCC